MKNIYCSMVLLSLCGCEMGISEALQDMIVVARAIDPALVSLEGAAQAIEDIGIL